ncbi:hypothetical protein [Rhizobium sp. 11_C7_N12_5]|uniref:hypothetical protein n=1 Tax=Rhizobium sp. 11_C7_N12_5 TaxID=3240770 RepID=UPI003F29B80F
MKPTHRVGPCLRRLDPLLPEKLYLLLKRLTGNSIISEAGAAFLAAVVIKDGIATLQGRQVEKVRKQIA